VLPPVPRFALPRMHITINGPDLPPNRQCRQWAVVAWTSAFEVRGFSQRGPYAEGRNLPISPLRSEQKPGGTRPTQRWVAADCLLLYYGEERGAGGSDSLIGGGASVGGAGRDLSKMARPPLVLRQRENSWQYFASSWAASLRANFSSGDSSGNKSDGMKTSSRKGYYTITNPNQAPSAPSTGSRQSRSSQACCAVTG
jgi:hypothetical protein